MIPLFNPAPLRDQRVFTSANSAAEARGLIIREFQRMGFTVDQDDSKVIARRGSKKEWWRKGLRHVPQRLELLPVQAEVEFEEAPGGSVVRVTLIDAWKGGIRAGADEVYAPCFRAVLDELSRSVHLVEVSPMPTPQAPAPLGRSRWTGRTRALAALALSVILLTLVTLFLQDILSFIVARFFR
jgi:hypothetical protein